MNPLLLIESDGPITFVTLNRPEKRNALNVALLEQLCITIAACESDSSQRILVLRGAGPTFCAGLDLEEASNPAVAHQSANLIANTLRALSETRLITIAAVHGAAIAGGAGLVSACDFAIATRDTQFGFPEVHRGLVPALIMTFLRRQLRERDARELLLLGELFNAERAHAFGLINRVVAEETALAAEIMAMAAAILKGAPSAIAHTKAQLAGLWPRSLSADLERALDQHLSARNSPEAQEGIAAFREKRAPKWTTASTCLPKK